MSTHTPEPWFICTTEPAEIRTHPYGGIVIGETIPNAYNASRAVACVNACRGMADPAKEIEQLRRELDEAMAKLSTVYRWIERNHPDGFIDSQSHLQNLDRVADAWHDKLQAMREAIKNANHFASIILAEAGKQWLATEPLPDVASIEAVAQQIKDELQPFLKP